MEDENSKLKKYLTSLIKQFECQDNPILLRELSMTAYKLMKREKEDLICCPTCDEIGLFKTYNYTTGNDLQVFNSSSTMKCENKHEWVHHWTVGDKVMFHEPIDQYYIYICSMKINENRFDFKRISGTRYYPKASWNVNTLEYDSR